MVRNDLRHAAQTLVLPPEIEEKYRKQNRDHLLKVAQDEFESSRKRQEQQNANHNRAVARYNLAAPAPLVEQKCSIPIVCEANSLEIPALFRESLIRGDAE